MFLMSISATYEDDSPHFVLEDKQAEAIRNSFVYRVRTGIYFQPVCGLIAALIAVVLCRLNDHFGFAPAGWIDLTINKVTFAVVAAVITFVVAGFWRLSDDLAPLESAFSINALHGFAKMHPQVAEYVTDALAKGNTFRRRDLHAAYDIDYETQAKSYETNAERDREVALAKLKRFGSAQADQMPPRSVDTTPTRIIAMTTRYGLRVLTASCEEALGEETLLRCSTTSSDAWPVKQNEIIWWAHLEDVQQLLEAQA